MFQLLLIFSLLPRVAFPYCAFDTQWLLIGTSTRDSGHARRVWTQDDNDGALALRTMAACWNSFGRWILPLCYVYSDGCLWSPDYQCNVKTSWFYPQLLDNPVDRSLFRIADPISSFSYYDSSAEVKLSNIDEASVPNCLRLDVSPTVYLYLLSQLTTWPSSVVAIATAFTFSSGTTTPTARADDPCPF
ncbi:hypothetical protein IW261DRAFT_1424275 [Armillaria novae-zelandiae]|uniref:Uncharacterized protein n=1 Tax=Armillaria novae-zelandiae TaxID=153914 RepID=A0AA39NVD9_9AGAR|nr:hypothetical protein IW261DRAFT_1424275 [Armillaria novae-zelandiae]